MAIRCTITKAGVVNEYGQALAIGTVYTPNNDDYALALISQLKATDTDDFLGERVNAPFDEVVYPLDPVGLSTDGTSLVSGDGNTYVLTPTGQIADAASRDITAADNGKSLAPTGTLTYTIPAGLSPMPSFTVDCPASGTITIARSGGATLNGAGTSLTRTRANNPVGFVVLAHVDTDAYGVSGA